jgi:hypothetical protein
MNLSHLGVARYSVEGGREPAGIGRPLRDCLPPRPGEAEQKFPHSHGGLRYPAPSLPVTQDSQAYINCCY